MQGVGLLATLPVSVRTGHTLASPLAVLSRCTYTFLDATFPVPFLGFHSSCRSTRAPGNLGEPACSRFTSRLSQAALNYQLISSLLNVLRCAAQRLTYALEKDFLEFLIWIL